VQADAVLAVRGSIDRRGGDEANLIVNELIPLDQIDARYTTGLVVRIDQRNADGGTLKTLHEIVRGYPGNRDLLLSIVLSDGSQVQLKSRRMKIDIQPELRRRLEELLGPGTFAPRKNALSRSERRHSGTARKGSEI
jgi:DNA polymerase III subunit alpha